MTIIFGVIACGCMLYVVLKVSFWMARTELRLDQHERETQTIRQWLDKHIQGVSMREDIEDTRTDIGKDTADRVRRAQKEGGT
jgi:hypothetical protein